MEAAFKAKPALYYGIRCNGRARAKEMETIRLTMLMLCVLASHIHLHEPAFPNALLPAPRNSKTEFIISMSEKILGVSLINTSSPLLTNI
jgi:hypothetical protein